MSTVEEKQITPSAEKTTEENTQTTESTIKSPWEEVVIVPGSARIHNGRKLPTLSDTLKNPKKVTAPSTNKPQIEVDSSLKPENKEQWNPVDLSHLLVTDAPQKPSRALNKRNTANSSSKRNSKSNNQSRSKSHDKASNKKADSAKLEKTHPRSNKSKFDTEKDYKKKPVNKTHSNRGKFEGKRFKVIDSASSTEYSEQSSEGSSLDNSEVKAKDEKALLSPTSHTTRETMTVAVSSHMVTKREMVAEPTRTNTTNTTDPSTSLFLMFLFYQSPMIMKPTTSVLSNWPTTCLLKI